MAILEKTEKKMELHISNYLITLFSSLNFFHQYAGIIQYVNTRIFSSTSTYFR